MIVVLIFGLSGTTILVKNFTRFSEEIFTGVIAIFFVVETSRTIVRVSFMTIIMYMYYSNKIDNHIYRFFSVIQCVELYIHVGNMPIVLIHVTAVI